MADRSYLSDLMLRQARVKITNPHNGSYWTGRIIGLADHPTVDIETDDGIPPRIGLPQWFDAEEIPPALLTDAQVLASALGVFRRNGDEEGAEHVTRMLQEYARRGEENYRRWETHLWERRWLALARWLRDPDVTHFSAEVLEKMAWLERQDMVALGDQEGQHPGGEPGGQQPAQPGG